MTDDLLESEVDDDPVAEKSYEMVIRITLIIEFRDEMVLSPITL